MQVDDSHNDVLQNNFEFVKQENARLTKDLVKTKVELRRAQAESRKTSEMDRGYPKQDKQVLRLLLGNVQYFQFHPLRSAHINTVSHALC